MVDARFPLLDIRFTKLDDDGKTTVREHYRWMRRNHFSRYDARYFVNADIDRMASYR